MSLSSVAKKVKSIISRTSQVDNDLDIPYGCDAKLSFGVNLFGTGKVVSYNESELTVKCSTLWPLPKRKDRVIVTLSLTGSKFFEIVGYIKSIISSDRDLLVVIGVLHDNSTKQKRLHPRAKIKLTIYYAPSYMDQEPAWDTFSSGEVVDLSAGGVKFRCCDTYFNGTILYLMFDVMSSAELFVGKVVRTARYGSIFEVAVQFDQSQMTEQSFKKLSGYVNSFLEK